MGRVVQDNKLSHKITTLFCYKFTEKAKKYSKIITKDNHSGIEIITLSNQKAG